MVLSKAGPWNEAVSVGSRLPCTHRSASWQAVEEVAMEPEHQCGTRNGPD